MPMYIYKCVNSQCSEFQKDVAMFTSDFVGSCPKCNMALQKQFPTSLHVKDSKKEVDGKDIGKVTKEKNDSLKKKHSGYSYEEQNLRQKMTKLAEEKIKKSGIK